MAGSRRWRPGEEVPGLGAPADRPPARLPADRPARTCAVEGAGSLGPPHTHMQIPPGRRGNHTPDPTPTPARPRHPRAPAGLPRPAPLGSEKLRGVLASAASPGWIFSSRKSPNRLAEPPPLEAQPLPGQSALWVPWTVYFSVLRSLKASVGARGEGSQSAFEPPRRTRESALATAGPRPPRRLCTQQSAVSRPEALSFLHIAHRDSFFST